MRLFLEDSKITSFIRSNAFNQWSSTRHGYLGFEMEKLSGGVQTQPLCTTAPGSDSK